MMEMNYTTHMTTFTASSQATTVTSTQSEASTTESSAEITSVETDTFGNSIAQVQEHQILTEIMKNEKHYQILNLVGILVMIIKLL